jgi:hypothetical protein
MRRAILDVVPDGTEPEYAAEPEDSSDDEPQDSAEDAPADSAETYRHTEDDAATG